MNAGLTAGIKPQKFFVICKSLLQFCKTCYKPYIIQTYDDYSNGSKDAFIKNCKASGIEIVYTGECMTTDTDYSSQAAQAMGPRVCSA